VGGLAFAATVMMIIGFFQIIAGLVAIIDDEFYVVTRNYTFDLDASAWGWIHLLVGLLVLGCGLALFARSTWAAVEAIFLAAFQRCRQLLLHSLLPVLVAAGDRPRYLGDLVTDPAGSGEDVDPAPVVGPPATCLTWRRDRFRKGLLARLALNSPPLDSPPAPSCRGRCRTSSSARACSRWSTRASAVR
jgi:hypothetical protein